MLRKQSEQLKGLQDFSEIKNQALLTIMNLQLNGYSEKEIADLCGCAKTRTSLGTPGQDQGNGFGKHDDNRSGNGDGSKWKLDNKLIGIN